MDSKITEKRSLFFLVFVRFFLHSPDPKSAVIAAQGGIWGLPEEAGFVPRPRGDIMSPRRVGWGYAAHDEDRSIQFLAGDLAPDIAGKQGLRVLIQGTPGPY